MQGVLVKPKATHAHLGRPCKRTLAAFASRGSFRCASAPHEFGSAAAASDSIHGHVFRSFALKHVAEFANLA
jgi:hypothetical protein